MLIDLATAVVRALILLLSTKDHRYDCDFPFAAVLVLDRVLEDCLVSYSDFYLVLASALTRMMGEKVRQVCSLHIFGSVAPVDVCPDCLPNAFCSPRHCWLSARYLAAMMDVEDADHLAYRKDSLSGRSCPLLVQYFYSLIRG